MPSMSAPLATGQSVTGPQVLMALYDMTGVLMPNFNDELGPSYDEIFGRRGYGETDDPSWSDQAGSEWSFFFAARLKWYRVVRAMRRDPTVQLARTLTVAPAMAAQWSYESNDKAPDGAKEFIEEQIEPWRMHLLEHAFHGTTDFGWQPMEKIFALNSQMQTVLKKPKQLLQDLTHILIDPPTGAFNGFRQYVALRSDTIDVPLPNSLLFNREVEGSNWYGQSTMRIVEHAFRSWRKVNQAADRYDAKLAGSHWVVHYPSGTSKVDGVEMDNYQVAQNIIRLLQSSGAIAVPSTVAEFVDDLNKDSPMAWKIEILSDEGKGAVAFLDRLKYLDTLKVRGFGLPERAVLEGQFGTKAEAEAHADFALTDIEIRHKKMVQIVNWHLINQLLCLNWGPEAENTVWAEPAPLVDTSIIFLRDMFKTILADPQLAPSELSDVDIDAIKSRLNIPRLANPESDDVKGPEPDIVIALRNLQKQAAGA